MKNIILCWSGGFDSTGVLLANLEWLGQKDYAEDKLFVVSCYLENASNREEDRAARVKIKDYVYNQSGLDQSILSRISFYESVLDWHSPEGSSAWQSSVWAFLAGNSVILMENSHCSVSFGYIKGDDFWHCRHEFEKIVRSIVDLNGSIKDRHSDYGVYFHYPYEWSTKKDILVEYIKFPSVFGMISWGGDTESVKLKEKEDLENTLSLMKCSQTIKVLEKCTKQIDNKEFFGEGI